MSTEKPRLLRMTIEFDQDSIPIAGRVEQPDHVTQEFEGIVELVALVEAARRPGSAGARAARPLEDHNRAGDTEHPG
jgi:hypothetical protein